MIKRIYNSLIKNENPKIYSVFINTCQKIFKEHTVETIEDFSKIEQFDIRFIIVPEGKMMMGLSLIKLFKSLNYSIVHNQESIIGEYDDDIYDGHFLIDIKREYFIRYASMQDALEYISIQLNNKWDVGDVSRYHVYLKTTNFLIHDYFQSIK